jgi:hypothetical protein
MDLTIKTDREILVMKVEMEQHLAQLQRQIQAVDNEIMKRVNEEKQKNDNA